jgi:hypothetical protein
MSVSLISFKKESECVSSIFLFQLLICACGRMYRCIDGLNHLDTDSSSPIMLREYFKLGRVRVRSSNHKLLPVKTIIRTSQRAPNYIYI